MKTVEYWQFIVDSETPPGKRIKTRVKMREEDVAHRNPEKVPGTMELREVYEPGDEIPPMWPKTMSPKG